MPLLMFCIWIETLVFIGHLQSPGQPEAQAQPLPRLQLEWLQPLYTFLIVYK